jgi:hypothetical protein
MGEEGEQLFAVGEPEPADGAVAEGGDREPAVARDVDRPGDAGDGLFPELLTLPVEQAEPPVGAEQEALAVRRDRQAARRLVLLQRQGLAVQGRSGCILPVVDFEFRRFGARRREGPIGLGIEAQSSREHLQPSWLLAAVGETEADTGAVARNGELVFLAPIIRLGGVLAPEDRAIRAEDANAGIGSAEDEPAILERPQVHDGALAERDILVDAPTAVRPPAEALTAGQRSRPRPIEVMSLNGPCDFATIGAGDARTVRS